jgi:hypothetical protein
MLLSAGKDLADSFGAAGAHANLRAPLPITSVCLPPTQPGPAEVYAALWLGALLAAAGELPDPFPPPIKELAGRYFEAYPPEAGTRPYPG